MLHIKKQFKHIACTANENSSVKRTKQNRLMLLSNCVVCGKKKSQGSLNSKI